MRNAHLLSTLLLLSGCRDLAVPPPEASQGKGPLIRVLSPQNAQRISLVYPVRLTAEDLDGVSEVTVRCGGLTLWTWVTPPYEAAVDFNACRQLAPAGATEFDAPLTFSALDAQGNATSESLTVNLDIEAPVLTVQAPARALPRSTVTVKVHSDRPLQGPPAIRLSGNALALTQEGPLDFTGTGQAPGLGTDGVAPAATGCAYPIELLEEVERPLTLSVQGRSLGGNETVQERTLLVSRVAWEKAIPGEVYLETAAPQDDDTGTLRPTAAAAGVQVPLQMMGGQWVPALFRAADGTFVPLAESLFAAAYRGKGIDALGRALLDDSKDLLLLEPGESVGKPVPIPTRLPARTMTRVGDALCIQTAASCANETLTCVNSGGVFNSNTVTGTQGDGLGGAARFLVRSKDTLLGLDFASSTACCASCAGRGLLGTVSALTYRQLLPATTSSIVRILPTGAGGFVVHHRVGAAAPVDQLALIDAAGATTASAYALPLTRSLLLARRDNSVVTTYNQPTTTPFESWKPGGATPDRQSCLPGTFQLTTPEPQPTEVPNHAVESPTGEVTVVLANEQFGRVIVHFDAQLVPKWVYRYPRLIVPEAHPNHFLVAADAGGPVYFVDSFNGYVVALGR